VPRQRRTRRVPRQLVTSHQIVEKPLPVSPGGAQGEGFSEVVDTVGEFVWAVRGAEFRPSRAPNLTRPRLIGRLREFATSIGDRSTKDKGACPTP
jgi:hypothetical protein